MRSRNAGLAGPAQGREPGPGAHDAFPFNAFPKYFCPDSEAHLVGLRHRLQSQGKKKSREVSAKQRWSREDGAALSGARMTPVPSVINDTKKSSSRWSNGLGSFKYKQITPQNERFCFNRTGRAQLRAPGRRTRAAGAAREHSESTTKRRAALGPPAARSPHRTRSAQPGGARAARPRTKAPGEAAPLRPFRPRLTFHAGRVPLHPPGS